MKRTLLLFSLLGLYLLSGMSLISAAPRNADFSGNWRLDRGATPNLPDQLDSYTMVVTQDAARLKVDSTVEMKDADESPSNPSPQGTGGGGYPGSGGGRYPGRTGISFPGGGGYPGGGSYPGGGGNYPRGGGPQSSKGHESGTRALRTYLPTASYLLNGNDTTTEVKGRMPGKATLKAKWKNGGKVLNLSTLQNLDAGGSTVTIKSEETWEFSKDGKNLKIKRTVKTPRGSDSIKLTFRKEDRAGGESTE